MPKNEDLFDSNPPHAKIKVIGVGGGGGNAIEHMMGANIQGAEFICANTDAQALGKASASIRMQLGGRNHPRVGCGGGSRCGTPVCGRRH